MIYNFVKTTDDLREVTVASATYKIPNNVMGRMIKECDKLFGIGGWKKVADYSTSLNNMFGWYALDKNGYETLEVRLQ